MILNLDYILAILSSPDITNIVDHYVRSITNVQKWRNHLNIPTMTNVIETIVAYTVLRNMHDIPSIDIYTTGTHLFLTFDGGMYVPCTTTVTATAKKVESPGEVMSTIRREYTTLKEISSIVTPSFYHTYKTHPPMAKYYKDMSYEQFISSIHTYITTILSYDNIDEMLKFESLESTTYRVAGMGILHHVNEYILYTKLEKMVWSMFDDLYPPSQ